MLGTIINYCTNDYRFIGKCIAEAKKFSAQIVIPVCDHFFDGSPENRPLLDKTYREHPDCLFIEFAYLPDRLYSSFHRLSPEDSDWSFFWVTTARYIGLHYLKPEIEQILFLDSDEVVMGDSFHQWLEAGESLDAHRLAAYLYALRPNLRAKKVVNLPLLVKRSTLAPLTLINGLDRIGAYASHPGPKRERIVGLDGMPMVHHYSWVRTKEECHQKARTWGHRNDEDWPTLIENTFSGKAKHLFDLSWHEFEEIENPFFNPFAAPPSAQGKEETPLQNVLKIDERTFFEKTLESI